MRLVIFAVLLCFSGLVFSGTRSGMTYVRLGLKTITHGDTSQKVVEAGGQPASKTDLINKFGVKLGEEWVYIVNNSRVYIEIDNYGTVTGLGNYIGN